MAATNVTLPTWADLAKRTDAGWTKSLPLINLVNRRHGLYGALRWEEANMGLSHRTSVATGLPTSAYMMFNQGLEASDGSYANATFPVAKIGTLAEVHAELIKVAVDKEGFLSGKIMLHVESLLRKLSSEMWYGTAATAEGIVGLSALYSSTTADKGQNALDAGGGDASDNASMWLLNIGPNMKGLYPRGTPAGIEREAVGYETSESLGGTGLKGRVYREFLHIGAGVAPEDWRDGVRVANIDVSAILAETNDADLIKFGRKAKARMATRPVYDRKWFMHPTIWEAIESQRDDRQIAGGGISKATIDGIEVPTFHGYEVVVDDNMVLTEAPIA